MNNPLNKKDMELIAHLRTDARMPLTKMSKKTCIPVSTLFDRLKANEDKFIVKHTSLLNFEKLGYLTRANITLKVEREDKDRLKEFLLKNCSINSVYRINNGFDFMIEAVFKEIRDLEEFLDDIEKKFRITDKKSFFIIEDVKRESFMSDPNLVMMDVKGA